MKSQNQKQQKPVRSIIWPHALVTLLLTLCATGCDQANDAAVAGFVAIDQATRDDEDDDIPPVPPTMSVVLFQGDQLVSDSQCAQISITNEVKTDRPPSDYFLGNYSEFADFYNDERNTHQIRGSMRVEQRNSAGGTQVTERPFDLGLDESGKPNGAAVMASPYAAVNGKFTFVLHDVEIDVLSTGVDGQSFSVAHFWGITGQVEINVQAKTGRRSYLPDERIEFVCGYKYKAYLVFEKDIPFYAEVPLFTEMAELERNGVDLSAW